MNTIAPDQVLGKIHNLPSLPMVVLELLATMDQEDVHVDNLTEKIAQDQALTAKTLRLANSSFFGMAHQIATIQEAIALVGFRTVRSLATTAALMASFAGSTNSLFNATPFWRHSIATAICAREVAAHLSVNPEYAYTAGLLHDIGRLVLVTHFAAPYDATMAHRSLHDCRLLDAERAVLGVDHAAVGHMLTRHWKFPEAMQQAVACHHAPLVLGMEPLSIVVIAADAFAHALDLSMDEEDLVPPVPTGLWQQLGLDEAALLEVLANAEEQFESASHFLNT